MTKKTKLIVALVAAFAAQGAMAGTDFNGYMRSGSGSSSHNGKETCFRLNNDSALAQGAIGGAGRLGNECDTYGEIALSSTGESDGTKFGVHTLMAFGAQQNQDYEQAVPAWREAYTSAQGFGNGAFAKATAWVGKRYYNRKDVHIVDFFWLQVTGPGAGIENIDLGFGKFSYALMRAGNSNWVNLGATDTQGLGRATTIGDPTKQITNHDLRLEGINLGAAGSLSFGTNIIRGNNAGLTGNNPNGMSAWLTHSKVFGTVQNGLTVQMARDAGSLDGAGLWWASDTSPTKHNAWRIIDAANFEFGEHVNGQAFLAYGREAYDWYGINNAADTRSSASIVVRPVYHFTENFSLAVEAGRSQVSGSNLNWDGNDATTTNYLNKITIAPQISMGSGFYSRPVLRAYVTWANWNAGGASACTGRDCLVAVPTFANDTVATTFGVQMESWW